MYEYWEDEEHDDEDEDENASEGDEDMMDFDGENFDDEELGIFDALEDFDDRDDPILIFDNYRYYIDWHDEISYRKAMLGNIELMIARIQNLHSSYMRTRILLYFLLTDYRERARSFLRRNARLRRLRKPHRRKPHLIRVIRYKYGLLQRMLARIDKVRLSPQLTIDASAKSNLKFGLKI